MNRQTFKDFKWTIIDNKKNESLASITSRVFLASDAELVGKIDDDMLLEPIIDELDSHGLEALDGDLWDSNSGGGTYDSFMRDMLRNL